MTTYWQPGNTVMLRTIPVPGRVGTVLPTAVVQDSDDLVALYLAPGTPCKRRAGKRGGPRGRLLVVDTGGHEDWTWSGNKRLILFRPRAMYAVSLFWRDSDNSFIGWYVDVLAPIRRSPRSFETRDLDLDVVIDPDRTWRLKDEDELVWRQQQGKLTPYDEAAIRREAERVVALLAANDPLFSDEWTTWCPDPSWPIPEVPDAWNVP